MHVYISAIYNAKNSLRRHSSATRDTSAGARDRNSQQRQGTRSTIPKSHAETSILYPSKTITRTLPWYQHLNTRIADCTTYLAEESSTEYAHTQNRRLRHRLMGLKDRSVAYPPFSRSRSSRYVYVYMCLYLCKVAF